MFPDLDKDIIDDVVRVKQGRYANIDGFYAGFTNANDFAFCAESVWQSMLALH